MKSNCTPYKMIICPLFCLFISFLDYGQERWIKDVENPKEFIENKGQFDEISRSSKTLFVANIKGVNIFFSSKGLMYCVDELVKDEEIKKMSIKSYDKMTEHQKEEEREKQMQNRKIKRHVVEMNWVNSNVDVEILKELEVQNYYAYNDINDKSGKKGLIAKAYKKLIYKNVYPNIDVEYFFVDGKEGFKYNIILHPGANVSDIQMKYSKSNDCKLDEKGNFLLSILDQEIKENAPVTYYESSQSIHSKFSFNNNVLGFELSNYDTSQKVIIDPLVITPNFNPINKLFDVDYDSYGNVFAFGGGSQNAQTSFKLNKYDASGTLQWTYSYVATVSEPFYSYGDFTIDKNTNNIYVVGNASFATSIITKIDQAGNQLTAFEPPTPQEIFRLDYDECNDVLIIAGGGTNWRQFNTLTNNLTNYQSYSLTGDPYDVNDIASLVIDRDGSNYYAMTHKSISNPEGSTCNLLKIPSGTIDPVIFDVNSAYAIGELTSILFHPHQPANPYPIYCHSISYNGLAVSSQYIYTSDGYSLKKWDKTNGTLYSTCVLSSTNDNSLIYWGGLDVDNCDNVYVGWGSTIRKYDSNLNLQSTINLPDTVYDVKLGNNNLLYACGNNFLATFETIPPAPISIEHTNNSSCGVCDGTASIVGICPEEIDDFSFLWNTVPEQTTPIATNLCPGTYTVTIMKNGCVPVLFFTGTVTIDGLNGQAILTSMTSTAISCTTNDATATVIPTGGTPPFSYSWNTNPVQTTATAINLSSGMMIVTVSDAAGCFKMDSIFIAPPNIPSSIAGSNSPICEGSTIYLTATNSSVSGSSYTWIGPNGYISSVQNSVILTSTTANAGTYLLITSANGCSDTSEVTVIINETPTANFSVDTVKGCVPFEVTFTNLSSPNSDSLTWDFGDGTMINTTSDVIAHTFMTTGVYSISLTTYTLGCSNTIAQFQMIQAVDNAVAKFNINPTEVTIFDPTIDFINLSTNASTYLWNFGDNSSSTLTNPTHTYAPEPRSFDVQLIANNVDNCPDTTIITVLITEPLLFYVPNTFTPDGNSFNEIFLPIMTSGFDHNSYSIKIYNRWGAIIFETKDISTGWDGKFKGEIVQDGTYTWEIIFKDKQTDKMYKYNGHINVLR